MASAMIVVVSLLACALAAPLASTAPTSVPRKSLAGPPEEFAHHTLPEPTMGALMSNSAAYFITLTKQNNKPTWTRVMDVDSKIGFSLDVYSPIEDQLTLTLKDPNGNLVDLTINATKTFYPIWDSDEQVLKGTSYVVYTEFDGEYTLSVTANSKSMAEIDSLTRTLTSQVVDIKHGYVILYNAGSDSIYSHLAAYTQQQGDKVGLAACMFNPSANPNLVRGQSPVPLPSDVIKSATLEAVFPDGSRLKKPMHDNGLNADGNPDDGIYGGSFSATEVGFYTVQSTLEGVNANGPFIRTAQHLVQVIPRSVQFTSNAFGTMSSNILNVNLEVSGDLNGLNSYRPYFQLWGKSSTGEDIPVGWFSSIENVVSESGKNVFSLDVDTAWIARAGAVAPFQLRDVYVQDVSSWIPVARAASMDLTLSASVATKLSNVVAAKLASGYTGAISLEMLQGVAPVRPATNGTNGGKLILLHGYCADKNPFQVYPEDWTADATLYFLKPKVSMTHDEYALNVTQFAADNGLTSFGLVGHSQGGIVTLHTYNYYHTGLDAAVGPRKIQSLASPYRGNSAAGSTADLGKVFGLGCGSNFDMSLDGAHLWYAGITANAIAQANYYTTVYDKGGLFGNGWCNMLTNALLEKPNDGTTEMVYATLDGGNHRSHVIGQCHIDGMNWPASYWDHARNQEMNSQAAR